MGFSRFLRQVVPGWAPTVRTAITALGSYDLTNTGELRNISGS